MEMCRFLGHPVNSDDSGDDVDDEGDDYVFICCL